MIHQTTKKLIAGNITTIWKKGTAVVKQWSDEYTQQSGTKHLHGPRISADRLDTSAPGYRPGCGQPCGHTFGSWLTPPISQDPKVPPHGQVAHTVKLATALLLCNTIHNRKSAYMTYPLKTSINCTQSMSQMTRSHGRTLRHSTLAWVIPRQDRMGRDSIFCEGSIKF